MQKMLAVLLFIVVLLTNVCCSRGREGPKAKFLKGKYKAKLEFPEGVGRGSKSQKWSAREVDGGGGIDFFQM